MTKPLKRHSEENSEYAQAWTDVVGGLTRVWMWRTMAFQDIRLRYRGSMLGPFWFTISTIIFLLAIGGIYSRLFDTPVNQYVPYLMIGFILWQYLSMTIVDGCNCFTSADAAIQEAALPYSVYILRAVARSFIIFLHSVIIIPIGLLIFDVPVSWGALVVIPAIVLIIINAIWVTAFFGLMSARYGDIPPIVANFVQVLFFVTPVFWHIDFLGKWERVAALNPFFAAIDIVRAPLVSESPNITSWPIMVGAAIFGCLLTFVIFARLRTRIPYWM